MRILHKFFFKAADYYLKKHKQPPKKFFEASIWMFFKNSRQIQPCNHFKFKVMNKKNIEQLCRENFQKNIQEIQKKEGLIHPASKK